MAGEMVKATIVNHQMDITISERGGLIIVGARILSWAQQKEETQD
jgi:hypothetical protein